MSELTFELLFSTLCNRLQSTNRVQEISKHFGGAKTDDERVQIAMKHLSEFSILPFKSSSRPGNSKSSIRSVELRNAGNKAFTKVKPNHQEALRLYTESIAMAPYPVQETDSSEELAIAFANRSAVFLAMKKYEDCLDDINRALTFNYPQALKFKLVERRGKCLQEMGRCAEASKSFLESLAALQLASLPDDKMKIKALELEKLQNVSDSTPAQPYKAVSKVRPLPEKMYGPNPRVPCASDCLDIKYSKEMGRYIEATKDMNPGDVVLIEEPYVSVVHPPHYKTHCFHCLQRYEALIPCSHCHLAMFCSENCQLVSWKNYHWLECSLLESLIKLEMGQVWLLALRIIVVNLDGSKNLQTFYSKVQDIEQTSRAQEMIEGFDQNGQYVSSDYRTMHHLVGNGPLRSNGDLYKRAVKAACILNCIDAYSEMFTNFPPADSKSSKCDDMKIFVGGILLHFLQSLPCNAHTVTDMISTTDHEIPKSVEFGSGAYATLSLINHACDPNVCRSNNGSDVTILIAVRSIKKGDQIFDNYGYHYALKGLQERLDGLRTQYYFTCQCKCCTNDWPTYKNVPLMNPVIICSSCRSVLPREPNFRNIVACINCNKEHDMLEICIKIQSTLQRCQTIYDALSVDCNDDFLSELSECLVFVEEAVQLPYKLFNDLQESLKECFMRQVNLYNL